MPSPSPDSSDWRLFEIAGRADLAYANALLDIGVLSAAEHDTLAAAFDQVKAEHAAGTLKGAELFTAIEQRLGQIAGPLAGKFQAGRSRHEQLLTALRVWLIEQMETLSEQVAEMQRMLLREAEGHVGALMPGYVQMQPAQIISCSHWLLSFFWMLARDQERLVNALGRTSILPLGSGLLAGSPYPIDRAMLAQALGLTALTQNSVDAVSDWDFAVEFLFVADLLGVHLSRLAEDLLYYGNPALGFVALGADSPAILAGLRSAASRIFGHFTGFLHTLKGLPSVYNIDAAEQRTGLYETVDLLQHFLPDVALIITTLTVHADRMWDAIDETILAADLIDYLAARGVPQAQAQTVIERVVQRADQSNTPLSEMELRDLQAESPIFQSDVFDLFDFSRSVGRHTTTGGTAPGAIRAQILQANQWLVDAGFE